jgi:hypothetical protein
LLKENGFDVFGFCGLREYQGEKIYPKAGS